VILKFYRKVYFSDTEACQGMHLFPLYVICDVMNCAQFAAIVFLVDGNFREQQYS